MSEMQKQIKEAKLPEARVAKVECVTCGGAHTTEQCTETMDKEIKAMGQFQNNPYSNTYNPGWRNHPNFSWKEQGTNGQAGNFQGQHPNQRFQGQASRPPPQEQAAGTSGGKKSLEELLESFINRSETNFKNQEASIKNLENQFGQLAKQVAERPPGKFPSDTVVNPRQENISVVTTRSGKIIDRVNEEVNEETPARKETVHAKTKVIERPSELGKIPFPKALVKKNLEKQFSKFLDIFKKLQINIPFSEALEQMPIYSKFMKDILTKRRKLRWMFFAL
ncbi:uncharacterized protein LOC130712907 [Lotus japonicus]|uniref:uncharacterized protein LOC130712907 n=1 Tax=Lotus japonicus TaxID=34305 RepID=UPI0025901355|nr:uncharacterized protein LOC130712907 [Lotus japonicus]